MRREKPGKKATVILCLLAVIAIIAGCMPQTGGPSADQPPVSPVQVVSPIPTPAPVNEETIMQLSASNSAFAFDLYQALRGMDGNLFYSPYSISAALAMTFAGARTTTEQQMATTLHFDLPQAQLHPAFHELAQSLAQSSASGEFELHTANSLWGQAGYTFRPEFLALLAETYGAALRQVDFMEPDAREQARLMINDWVSEQTKGKIQDLIGPGALSELTRLVLANAIYFLAEWEAPFEAGTEEREFTLLNGDKLTVPMMTRKGSTRYAAGADYEAVELTYKGGRMQMLVLAPLQGQFESMEATLDPARLEEILGKLKPTRINLTVPKFEYEMSLELADTLAAMGMPDAFSGSADFSGMTENPELAISRVIHKAFVAVNEKGTEAAAATAVVMELTSAEGAGPQVVVIDRPFIFLIRDSQTGAILFVGRVLNPAG